MNPLWLKVVKQHNKVQLNGGMNTSGQQLAQRAVYKSTSLRS